MNWRVQSVGSNKRQHETKWTLEWGQKSRKEESNTKRNTFEKSSIADSEIDGAPVSNNKRRKKNTKLWCRGKVGREHEWQDNSTAKSLWYLSIFTALRCGNCGKEKVERKTR